MKAEQKFATMFTLSLFLSFATGCSTNTSVDTQVIDSSTNYDWTTYGGGPASEKYAALDQINAANIKDLQVAWLWDSVDNAQVAADSKFMPLGNKITPIKIGNILYTSTSLGYVVALNASTGEQKWVFDTDTKADGRPANLGFNHRGVSYWAKGDKRRILMPTNNSYLWSLNADTGEPDEAFGDKGRIDLTLGLGREVKRQFFSSTAAPAVVGDIVIMGSIVADYPMLHLPPGHVRGFDIETGAQKWIFHTIPQSGEFANNTWEKGSWKYSGGTNVWSLMSVDAQLGYVYMPVGTPNNDWYGGHRLGDNLFAESLVCLDAATGKRVWHYQMVHHGLWDYDLPAAPNLIDITVDGKAIKAVAQVSKQGFIYVFDRVTGEPVWPIEERAVPQSSVPGERSSATQPFPTHPAPFELQGISDATLIDYTPELRAEALKLLGDLDYGELFTPPSQRGTVQLPGWGGGANWTGAAVDPETSMIYIPSVTGPIVVQVEEPKTEGSQLSYVRGAKSRVRGPKRLPITKPPYGRISAIDLNSGDYQWVKANAEGIRQKIIDMGIPDPGPVGTMALSGPLLTKSLLFLAIRDGGRDVLRAMDKKSGELVYEVDLPGNPQGTPMTYMVDGKQYIAISLGGMKDAKLVALALP